MIESVPLNAGPPDSGIGGSQIVQEAYRTHSELGAAAGKSIEHGAKMLEADSVSAHYGMHAALSGVSLRVGRGEVVSVLGPGSFFGEKALLNDEPVAYSVRARTAVKVLVMGRNVFTQISGTLAPLRDAIAETLNRRSIDFRKLHPEAHDALKGVAIRELMESVPSPLFKPTSTLAEIGRAFAEHNHELFYVCGEEQSLEGVVTMTDWMRALSRGATAETPVTVLMVCHPIMLSVEEDGAMAASVIR